jgi:hypothetical protein
LGQRTVWSSILQPTQIMLLPPAGLPGSVSGLAAMLAHIYRGACTARDLCQNALVGNCISGGRVQVATERGSWILSHLPNAGCTRTEHVKTCMEHVKTCMVVCHLICTQPPDLHDGSTTPAAQHPMCQRTPALAHACHEYLR